MRLLAAMLRNESDVIEAFLPHNPMAPSSGR
jgi:hypothetical protein